MTDEPDITFELLLHSPEVDGSGAVTLFYGHGSFQQLNIIGDITSITITGWPGHGTTGRMIVLLKNTGNFTIAPLGWTNTRWVGGVPPTPTLGANKEDMVVLATRTAGAVVYGNIIGQNYSAPV